MFKNPRLWLFAFHPELCIMDYSFCSFSCFIGGARIVSLHISLMFLSVLYVNVSVFSDSWVNDNFAKDIGPKVQLWHCVKEFAQRYEHFKKLCPMRFWSINSNYDLFDQISDININSHHKNVQCADNLNWFLFNVHLNNPMFI